MSKQDLLNFNIEELQDFCISNNLPKFRATQIWRWMYCFGLHTFEGMNNIARATKDFLNEKAFISRPEISETQKSSDGTIKWLLKLSDGSEIETVYIPQEDRGTVCLSSQVGCTLNCSFCHTGTQALVRNLTANEINGQLMLVMDYLKDWPSGKKTRKVTNVVMMGMGEPLLNYKEVSKAIKVMMSDDGISLSRRKITLSTSGIIPMIEASGIELGVNLAISLHAVNDELRDQLVPINKKYNLEALIKACRNYPPLSNSRRITWEYVMIKGVNDRESDAKELINLIKGIPSKINLIPFNPWPGSLFETSTQKNIDIFAKILMDAGFASPIRKPRGQDIYAACGQLKSTSEKIRKSQINRLTPIHAI
ncbi:23S rRNA (adenine(2503)-C(2))-methyltransferase RlmN [Alphaproteobacteria bacterium]|nr:23S rRNA (adenine(2503)-C(2))-methyltransferase RlmN [Alphaproteobacteria bacterium]